MALTLMQKLRLWWSGSQRRRDDFAAKNAGWGNVGRASARPEGDGLKPVLRAPDREGLLSAYLDQSGRTLYYLDRGEVIESSVELDLPRIPTQDEAADRQAFIQANGLNAAANFRETIARDRTLERAWYNFKTQRAIAAVDDWLKRSG